MDLAAAPNLGGPQRQFPPANQSPINGERKENVGIADGVMVEEILRAGAERVRVKQPAFERNGDSNLGFLVALAAERDETQILVGYELQQWPGSGEQWRRLVGLAVRRAQHPVQIRNLDGNSGAGACSVLNDPAGEVSLPNAAAQGEPRRDL